MSKRDYELIARVLRQALSESSTDRAAVLRVLELLSRELAYDNPKFDCNKFSKAILS